jgi:hypothetical protein
MSAEQGDFLPPAEAPDASSKMFREYAVEFLELARNATSVEQRFLYQNGEYLAGDHHSLGKRFAQGSAEASPRQHRRAAVSMFLRERVK